MTPTPAKELARLKIAYPGWAISRSLPGGAVTYRARELTTGKWIIRPTLAELEYALRYGPDGREPRSR